MVKLIAEIGCNHMGDFNIACSMVREAANCGADIVKFQKRNPKECLTEEQYNAPHPVPSNSFGSTYGEHREKLEFNIDQHRSLRHLCYKCDVEYSTSVWDLTSAKEVVEKVEDLKIIKIPSACNLNFKMLDYICDNFGGEIHISLGMTTQKEEDRIIDFLSDKLRIEDTVLYACTSDYPAYFDDLCLLEIERLKKSYSDVVKGIGFSGHHLGIAVDIAAMTLGATYIERHFTLDRTWKGTDHAASLEPQGLTKLSRDLHNVSRAFTYKRRDEILDCEVEQRKKLNKRVVEVED